MQRHCGNLSDECTDCQYYKKRENPIKEIKGDRYVINEYDGCERVVEPDDINWIIVEGQNGRNEYGSLSGLQEN